MGSTHKVCEDFALSGFNFFGKEDETQNEDNTSYHAIVCDGCSSSGVLNGRRNSLNVDFGARILAACAVDSIEPTFGDIKNEEKAFKARVLKKVKTAITSMGLSVNILDATLLVAKTFGSKRIVYAYGDGTIVLKYPDGSFVIYNISYSGNAPYYLSYDVAGLKDKYISNYGQMGKKVRKIIYQNDELKLDSEYDLDSTETFILESKDSDVFLFSDGIESFTKNSRDFVPFTDILAKSLDVKGKRGEYLHRVTNLLNRYCEKEGLYHTDDYSTAGIITVEEFN